MYVSTRIYIYSLHEHPEVVHPFQLGVVNRLGLFTLPAKATL